MLACVDANLSPVVAGRRKGNHAVNQGKEGIVLAHAHVVTGVNARAPLPHQYSAGIYLLTSVYLDSQPLGLAISAATAGAACFLMRHPWSPLFWAEPSSAAWL